MAVEKIVSRIKETSINVANGKIESIRRKDVSKTGIRVYRDGYIGVAGAIGNVDYRNLQKVAEEALQNKIPYEYDLSREKQEVVYCKTDLPDENEIVKEVEGILETLNKEYPQFLIFNKVNLGKIEKKLTNNKNLELTYRDKYISLELVFKDRASANIMDGFIGYEGREYDREKFLKSSREILNAFMNKVELPKDGKYPVIFGSGDPLPAMKILGELNGNLFGAGGSLFSGKIGEKTFSKDFTLYQSNNAEDGFVSFFDGEGVVNKDHRFALIEDGKIIAPYTDKRTAAKYNLPLTGSAVSEYDSVPSLGINHYRIKESNKTIKELLNGEKGIYVMISSGGDYTSEGTFGAPVQLAFLFDENGLIGRLPEIQISSDIYKMFGEDYRGVSSDYLDPLSKMRALIMDLDVSKL